MHIVRKWHCHVSSVPNVKTIGQQRNTIFKKCMFEPSCFSFKMKLVLNSKPHYSDVIMNNMASQVTSVSIVCSNVCSGADRRKHQSPASLAFVRGIHRWPVDSPLKRLVTRKMFPFNDVIMFSSPLSLLWKPKNTQNIWPTSCILTIDLHITKQAQNIFTLLISTAWKHRWASRLHFCVEPFYKLTLTFIPAWLSNNMPSKIWDEIT